MKVPPTGSIVAGEISAEKKKAIHPSAEGTFETLLKKAVDGSDASQGEGSSIFFPTVTCTGLIGIQPPAAARWVETIDRAEKLLTLLDDYSSKLTDPRYTLREIHGLVVEMEREKDLLLPLVESMPEGDPARDLLNRVLVTATVESIKFNRGDYLP